jgi:hypothetical protein
VSRPGIDVKVADKGNRSKARGAGGIWFLGFIGALVYYVHTHSGTFWLVLVAIMKAVVWPAFLVYHLLALKP